MDSDLKKKLLREMLFARRFEERCYEAYVERKIGGFLHLYSGEEACAHGVIEAAQAGHDYVITSYRDHVHAIKCGMDPKVVMAELYAKETGCCKGLGGSMHIFGVEHRFMGGYALVGGPFPLAGAVVTGQARSGAGLGRSAATARPARSALRGKRTAGISSAAAGCSSGLSLRSERCLPAACRRPSRSPGFPPDATDPTSLCRRLCRRRARRDAPL